MNAAILAALQASLEASNTLSQSLATVVEGLSNPQFFTPQGVVETVAPAPVIEEAPTTQEVAVETSTSTAQTLREVIKGYERKPRTHAWKGNPVTEGQFNNALRLAKGVLPANSGKLATPVAPAPKATRPTVQATTQQAPVPSAAAVSQAVAAAAAKGLNANKQVAAGLRAGGVKNINEVWAQVKPLIASGTPEAVVTGYLGL